MSAWRFIATRLNGDGTETHLDPEAPLREVSITEYRNAPTEISASIEPEYLDLEDAAGFPLLEKWSTGFYCERDGDIRAGGIFVDDSVDGPVQNLDIMGMSGYPNGQPYTEANSWPDNPPVIDFDEGLEDVFEDRVVIKSVPYTKTVYNKKTKTTTAMAGWKQVKEVQKVQVQWARDPELGQQNVTGYPVDGMEPMYGIREIWRHLQAQPGGNLGMQIDPMVTGKKIGKVILVGDIDTENGPLALEYNPFTLSWFKDLDLGDVINNLCENVPLEFREEHFWNEDRTTITHFLRFGHPRLGARRLDTKFVIGENVQPVSIDPPADEYASHILGLGAGEARAMPRADITRYGEHRLRRAVVFEDKTARTAAAINLSTQAELLARIGVDEVSTIEVRPGHVDDLQHLMPGDEVLLVGEQAHRDVEMWVRIESKTTTCDTDALEFGVQRVDRLA